ncbi:MAG: CBS domain-containing protein [Endomicrobiales bacterium]|jgi:CBS domain-containing protein/uncharacterized protein YrrD
MNQKFLHKNFIFMSQVIGAHVQDAATGLRIGKIVDIIAIVRDLYPRVTGLVIRKGWFGPKIYVPWKNVRKIADNMAMVVEVSAETVPFEKHVLDNEILLRETFWDQQIVDISGSKVVRVNDLHFLREDLNFWVVHIDVGFKGLVRRLGCGRIVELLMQWLFSYAMKDRLVQWKFVQPVSADNRVGNLTLKTSGAKLSELHPADVADILQDLGTDERVVILNALERSVAADVLSAMPLKLRIQTAQLLSDEHLSYIVRDMPVDEAVDLLSQLTKKRVNSLYALLPKEKVTQISDLLGLSEKIAGSIMNVEHMSVRTTTTAGQAIDKIKAESHSKETVYYIYVVDDNDVLIGATTLRQLLVEPSERLVIEFMRRRTVKVHVDTDIKDVAEIFYKYDFTVVPVVDRQNKLKGIVTIKDALEAVFPQIREETENES